MEKPRITINLMDVSFLEQNLQQILEVSDHVLFETLFLYSRSNPIRTLPYSVRTGGISPRTRPLPILCT